MDTNALIAFIVDIINKVLALLNIEYEFKIEEVKDAEVK